MTTMRTSLPRRSSRSLRGAVIALAAGAGVALTPAVASASAEAPAAAAPAAAAPVAAPNAAAQTAVDAALSQQGKPYAWGGSGPSSYDCSGLVQYAYRAAGIELPHSSRMQSTMGAPVDRASLQPGDLVFYYSPVSHVGIYIGNGQMVHSSTYGKPVAVVDVDDMPGYNSARRIA
ncbi:NlpC/P60 family protein [Blastococcus sp. SYSU D00820]